MHPESEQSPQPQQAGEPASQNPPAAGMHRAGFAEQAKAEAIGLLIEALENRVAGVPLPDDPLSEAGQKYDALIAWYQKHIAAARARLMAMEH